MGNSLNQPRLPKEKGIAVAVTNESQNVDKAVQNALHQVFYDARLQLIKTSHQLFREQRRFQPVVDVYSSNLYIPPQQTILD